MVLKKKIDIVLSPYISPFPVLKAEGTYLVHAKMDSWGRRSSNKLIWLMSINHEALFKAQQYKYYIHHMNRKLSNIRAHIDVYNVREWDHRFVKHG